MSNSSFIHYLKKIKIGKSINIKIFLKLAEKQHVSETQLRQILNWTKHKQNLYQLDIIDQDAFKQLYLQYNVPTAINRVQASKQGNSHKKSVSGSMLTILPYQKKFPQVVLFAQDASFQTTHTPHKQLLIVENLENFLTLVNRPDLLVTWLDQAWPCDIVYAAGIAISNKLHKNFFSVYATIRCLLDIDLGGFTIYKNICTILPKHTKCEFVFSQYYQDKYMQYANKINEEDYQKLINFDFPPEIHHIYSLIKTHQKFAEQEILIED